MALSELHRPREALGPLRRAIDIRRRFELSGAERGETWFVLARAQWEAGDDRVAARTAREEYAKSPGTEAKVRAVDAWLAAHGGRVAH